MRSRLAGLVGASLLAGCGVYGIRLDPPPARPLAAQSPLDLTVSLGDVTTVRDGRPVTVDPATARAIETDFVRAASRSHLFRDVVSRGSPADLRCEVVRELHSAPLTPARSAYLLVAGPLTVLAPGYPHPWDYRINRVLRLRGNVDGNPIPLLERRTSYDERVWGANYWGGLTVDPLREREGDYVVAALADAVADNRALLDDFATAARAHDVEAAWLVSLRASHQTPP